MEKLVPTTPFGRRPVSLGQIAAQLDTRRIVEEARRPGSNHPSAVNKWHLFRTLTEVRGRLGLSDRTLSVLNALLTFHPETALSLPPSASAPEAPEADPCCDLVVFPSNKALSLRAHGIAPATLWRHLTALVDAGLLERRDSPNGKRYARKAEQGATERFSHAYGFDLTPLVARAPELEALAEEVRRDARTRHLLNEKVSLLRRDVRKMLALGLDEGLPGPWEDYRLCYLSLMTPLRRIGEDAVLRQLAEDLAALRDAITATIARALTSHVNVENLKSNAHQNEEHLSSSKTQSSTDLEPAVEQTGNLDEGRGGTKDALPLGLVLEACPDVLDYADGGVVKSWRAFLDVTASIRPMVGISPDAWRSAREALGETEAHVAVAAILQRSIHSSEARLTRNESGGEVMTVNGSPAIQSPGGYLRSLVEQAAIGRFSTGPLLMALIGQRLKARRAGG